MKKKEIIQEIQNYLIEELTEAEEAKNVERATEIKRLQTMYRFMPAHDYGPEDVIVPSSLVELKLGETSAHYFIAPQGGGLVTSIAGKPVQIITPNSPLGEVLLGRKQGDTIEVESRGGKRSYRVVRVA